MKSIMITLLLLAGKLVAQDNLARDNRARENVAHFSFWKPKPGLASHFESGYKKHLEWHRLNGDKWSWYGWYIISGPRFNQFVDATFNHAWGDFDKSVKPAEDGADNDLHTFPFGDFEGGYKMINLASLSSSGGKGLKSKFLRMLTVSVTDIDSGKKLVQKLMATCKSTGIKSFLTFKPADGINLNQLVLLIGLQSWEEFGKTENIQETLSVLEASMKVKTITNISSETLVYREDLSLFPNQ